MFLKKTAIAVAMFTALLSQAHATLITTDGSWNQFDVDDLTAQSGGVEWIHINDGTQLNYQFTIANGFQGKLTVVDAVFAGDTFKVFNGNTLLGTTSPVTATNYEQNPLNLGYDFDAALANSQFSKATYILTAGTYDIHGMLDQSVLLGGTPLNSTSGALKVEVAAVPVPSTLLSLISGLALIGCGIRRRNK
ncbi:PEP-CTERM sorting domain-containing protein [Ampullimonas aquatilis]|uniref:PEP-CTERM sorting domain-containing protein n=1 Tax=Ampullimonas aquatilis TaxID=1341549 RepID=UPI003C726D23